MKLKRLLNTLLGLSGNKEAKDRFIHNYLNPVKRDKAVQHVQAKQERRAGSRHYSGRHYMGSHAPVCFTCHATLSPVRDKHGMRVGDYRCLQRMCPDFLMEVTQNT